MTAPSTHTAPSSFEKARPQRRSTAQRTFANYREILTNPVWYSGYINSIIYVTINTVIEPSVVR